MLNNNLFYEIGIQPKGNSIQQKLICPNCVKIGKTNIKDTCLSVNLVDGLFNCHKCGWNGCVKKGDKKEYQKPIKTNFTKISIEALQLFTSRGITQEIVNSNKIVQEGEWIIFPYLRNGQLVNVKKRSIKTKDFRQSTGAESIIYNYDRVNNEKEIIICEGEFDCMAFEVAGFTNVTSVNQGAPNENDKNIDKKLECITNCYEVFEQAEKIFIAVDKDANGKRLENELIRRFGFEKCLIIPFLSDCKDANDMLLQFGKESLLNAKLNAYEVKADGIYTIEDVKETMLNTFLNGKTKGTSTYFGTFDKNFTHRTGEVTLWTGYMNEGKSTFVKQLLLAKAYFEKWKIAVFSPEEFPPDEFFDDLIHMLIGKSTDRTHGNYMSRTEYEQAMDFIKKHFFYVYPEKDFTWQSVEEKLNYLIRKKGIRSVILDPYNQFDHNQGNQREDLYISKFMAYIKRFALINDISIHLVAHQVTPIYVAGQDYPQPNAYRIKGGGTFADKADNVICVWRPFRNTDKSNPTVKVLIDKIKKQRLTGVTGEKEFIYDFKKNRYYLEDRNAFDEVAVKQSEIKIEQNNYFLNDKYNDEPF
jgi:twinkle protein